MELDATFFALAVPAVIFAGISKGGFGSGAAFAAAPLLALVVPPQLAVGVMLPLLMLMDIANLRPYWRKWSWPDARALMIGMVPGVVLGVILFRYTSDDAVRLAIGAIALGFVAFQIGRGQGWITVPPRPFSANRAMGWGAVSGFTSFVSHAGGPPAAVHLLGQQLSKEAYQGTTVIIFWWVNVLKFFPYLALGLFTRETAVANLILAPVALAGTFIGVWAHRVVPEVLFFRITYVLLTITGAKLIWDALV
ncbi:sulfite exporter TauE/SafE family protein [Pontivivens ytuae]|uniref:sulfite exporter TauE/SafE family protein n=1 Tax=Pontivivens ytuae TaxID=2789856 RepID=UPI001E283CEC|nr:sulfite exporter TauE/SafE family protein [Pontivivens ytuae]